MRGRKGGEGFLDEEGDGGEAGRDSNEVPGGNADRVILWS